MNKNNIFIARSITYVELIALLVLSIFVELAVLLIYFPEFMESLLQIVPPIYELTLSISETITYLIELVFGEDFVADFHYIYLIQAFVALLLLIGIFTMIYCCLNNLDRLKAFKVAVTPIRYRKLKTSSTVKPIVYIVSALVFLILPFELTFYVLILGVLFVISLAKLYFVYALNK